MTTNTKMGLFKQRRWARRLAMQALYQWQLSGSEITFIEKQFIQDENFNKSDNEYFKEILYGVPEKQNEIDEALSPYLDRNMGELDPVELAILRMATYELLYRKDVPYRVVLDEALELAKSFGATEGYKFVNGILDKVARNTRQSEI